MASPSEGPGGAVVGALQEEALAVDRQLPVVEHQRPQADACARGCGSTLAVLGEHLDGDVVSGPGRRGPAATTASGSGTVDRPLQLVLARGEAGLGVGLVAPPRPGRRWWQLDGAGRGGVERRRGSARVAGSALASRAEHREAADADGPGPLDAHRPPDPARVPVGVEAVPVLEDAGEVALGGAVAGGRAGDLDGEEVLGPVAQRVGDLEGVGEEVALGVAQVAAVEPDVGLVEDAVEDQPGPLAVGGRSAREAGPGRAAGRRPRRRPGRCASARAR